MPESECKVQAEPRDPLYSPRVGDVWELANGYLVVVDCYRDFRYGFTVSNGEYQGFDSPQEWTDFLKQYEAAIVIPAEEQTWTFTGERNYSLIYLYYVDSHLYM